MILTQAEVFSQIVSISWRYSHMPTHFAVPLTPQSFFMTKFRYFETNISFKREPYLKMLQEINQKPRWIRLAKRGDTNLVRLYFCKKEQNELSALWRFYCIFLNIFSRGNTISKKTHKQKNQKNQELNLFNTWSTTVRTVSEFNTSSQLIATIAVALSYEDYGWGAETANIAKESCQYTLMLFSLCFCTGVHKHLTEKF